MQHESLKEVPAPHLSVCLIVRDERENIASCIESVKDLSPDVVVLDTGSQDGTDALAESLGAKVHRAPWEGDFSKARNACLGLAQGRWVLFLDADERLSASSLARLRHIADQIPSAPHARSVKFINHMGEGDGDEVVYHYYARLFPRMQCIEYRGRLHEQLWNTEADCALPTIIEEEIIIHHYGYDSRRVEKKEKFRRNEEILLQAIEEEPDNWFHRHNYGVSLFGRERFFEALAHLQKAEYLAEKHGMWHFDTTNYYYQALIHLETGDPFRAVEYCRKALARNDNYYDVYFVLGKALRAAGDYAGAIESFHRACFDGRPRAYPTSRVFQRSIGEWVALFEAACVHLDDLDDPEKALECLNGLDRFKDRNPVILLCRFRAHMSLGNIEAAEDTAYEHLRLFPEAADFLPEVIMIDHHVECGDAHSLMRFVERLRPCPLRGPGNLMINGARRLYAKGRCEGALELYLFSVGSPEEGSMEEKDFLNVSDCCVKLGLYDEGIAVLRNALGDYPGSAAIRNDLAALLMDKGDFQEADRFARAALDIDDQMHIARFNLAKIEYRLGNMSEAARHFQHLVEKDAYKVDCLLFLAAIRCDEERCDTSIALLEEVISLRPDRIEAYGLLAKNFRIVGKDQIAVKLEESIEALAVLAAAAR
jgi:tetratricopeptide (TPR) repeat protein